MRWLFLSLPFFLVTSASAELRVGVALEDITPSPGVSMDGSISQNGPVEEIHDPLHVRSIVVSDGEEKIAFAVVDTTVLSASLMEKAKTLVESGTGISGSHVIISATHTHSTPRAMVGLVDEPSFVAYLNSLPGAVARAIAKANDNLQPATAGWASVDIPDHVHNRRWFVEKSAMRPNPFGLKGDKVSMNPGREGLIKPAGPVDPELYLLCFRKADGNPLGVMGNYGLHYVGGTKRGVVSADYFAAFSESIGKQLGADESFLGVMTNGTSGDVNAIDFSKPRETYPPFENIQRVADDIAGKAAPVVQEIEGKADLTIDAVETILKLRVRKPDAARLEWARKTAAPPNSPLRLTRPQVYAKEALGLADYPDVMDVKIQAFRLGDLGIVSIPNEVFAETGLAIKENSPFADTFVIELANGYHGYLPTEQQHQWGGYETWPARSAYLEEKAEGEIRQAALGLLRQLKERQ